MLLTIIISLVLVMLVIVSFQTYSENKMIYDRIMCLDEILKSNYQDINKIKELMQVKTIVTDFGDESSLKTKINGCDSDITLHHAFFYSDRLILNIKFNEICTKEA